MGRHHLCRALHRLHQSWLLSSPSSSLLGFFFHVMNYQHGVVHIKKKWIVSLNGERVNSHRRSTSKTISWCHIMALENSYSVWIWRTWKIDQLVLISLTWEQINFFPLFEGVHRNTLVTKRVGTIALPFHLTLIEFWFYFIFPFILFHRFSMTQNKSGDRINKKTLPQESINFLYTFTRGKKISVSFIWFTYNVVLLF